MTPLITAAATLLLAAGGAVLVSLPDAVSPDPPRNAPVNALTAPGLPAVRPPLMSGARPSSGVPHPSAVRPGAAPVSGARSQSDSGVATTSWRWPLLVTPRVVRGFEPPPKPWLPGHRGVDLAAVPGDVVVAAGAGTITYAGPLAGRGVITVWHGELRTTYEPVTATVEVGDHVEAGEQIGVLAAGASHCGGVPPCLHWGLLRGTTYLDPLLLLGLSHPILLPIPN